MSTALWPLTKWPLPRGPPQNGDCPRSFSKMLAPRARIGCAALPQVQPAPLTPSCWSRLSAATLRRRRFVCAFPRQQLRRPPAAAPDNPAAMQGASPATHTTLRLIVKPKGAAVRVPIAGTASSSPAKSLGSLQQAPSSNASQCKQQAGGKKLVSQAHHPPIR